ncbi:MAG TPA: two pore domain potassium channel family protein, partial [Trueperaceae bacterium]|nr:two pore domain potassium channel family protein [Trueperaceae bacterium]
PNTLSQPNNFLNSLYFSFVTFTTLGFGDISPISSIAKFLVILEVFIGYLMLGLLVTIISKKVIPN